MQLGATDHRLAGEGLLPGMAVTSPSTPSLLPKGKPRITAPVVMRLLGLAHGRGDMLSCKRSGRSQGTGTKRWDQVIQVAITYHLARMYAHHAHRGALYDERREGLVARKIDRVDAITARFQGTRLTMASDAQQADDMRVDPLSKAPVHTRLS